MVTWEWAWEQVNERNRRTGRGGKRQSIQTEGDYIITGPRPSRKAGPGESPTYW